MWQRMTWPWAATWLGGVSSSQIDLIQHYPKPGGVEHDPEAIADAAIAVCRRAVEKAGLGFADITCINIQGA